MKGFKGILDCSDNPSDWLNEYIGYAEKTGIGSTVFVNKGKVGTGLKAYNWISNPFMTLIDYYI